MISRLDFVFQRQAWFTRSPFQVDDVRHIISFSYLPLPTELVITLFSHHNKGNIQVCSAFFLICHLVRRDHTAHASIMYVHGFGVTPRTRNQLRFNL